MMYTFSSSWQFNVFAAIHIIRSNTFGDLMVATHATATSLCKPALSNLQIPRVLVLKYNIDRFPLRERAR